jgi:hypothetical protein
MGAASIYMRTYRLLVNPGEEHVQISAERKTVAGINTAVIMPYAGLVALFSLLGSLFQHLRTPIDSYIFIALDAIIVFFIVLLQTYFSGLIMIRIARWMKISFSRRQVYGLVAYSEIPFFLVLALIKLFPSLIFLIFLGAYTTYLLYAGTERLFKLHRNQQVQFLLLAMIVMTGTFILLSIMFSWLYSEIVSQFSTFAIL